MNNHAVRLHAFDNLRALAMLAGVAFHAGLAFSPLAHPFFPTADRQQVAGMDVWLWFLHLFRMPVFFLLAGYFCAHSIARRGMGGLFQSRFKRIVLVFVLFWPLLHWLINQLVLQAATEVHYPPPLMVALKAASAQAGFAMPLGTAHLWFLYYLILFYVLVWIGSHFGLTKFMNFFAARSLAWHVFAMPLALLPALLSVSAPHPAPESPLPAFWAMGFYGLFFFYGMLLQAHPHVLERWRPHIKWLVLGSGVLYVALLHWIKQQTATNAMGYSSLQLFHVQIALAEAVISLWMGVSCLLLAKHWLDWANPRLNRIAESSFWIYLIHLPLLFAIQFQMMDLNWHWGIKFALATIATLAIGFVSFSLVVQKTPLRFLLGTSNRSHTSADIAKRSSFKPTYAQMPSDNKNTHP